MGYRPVPGPVELMGGISAVVERGQAIGGRLLMKAGVSRAIAQDTMDVVTYIGPPVAPVAGVLGKAGLQGVRFTSQAVRRGVKVGVDFMGTAARGAAPFKPSLMKMLAQGEEVVRSARLGSLRFTRAMVGETCLAGESVSLRVPTAEVRGFAVSNLVKPLRGVQHLHVKEARAIGMILDNARKNVSRVIGRSGKQKRLKALMLDDKLGSADRGWIRQEVHAIKTKSKRMSKDRELKEQKNIRVPPGKHLAHKRNKAAKDGFGYEHSDLQEINLHLLQHKHEGY